jgi:hypothetical protein
MKDFTLYPEALELKQLGFNEPTFFAFDNCSHPMRCTDLRTNEQKFNGVNYNSSSYTSQPTYSQAFRFFRENYDIHYSIDRERSQHDFEWGYNWSIYNYTGMCEEYVTSHPDAPAGEWVYETYEEAELACLKEMIKIVKEKQ